MNFEFGMLNRRPLTKRILSACRCIRINEEVIMSVEF